MDPGLLQFLRLKLLEGKDSFILEGCFSDTVFNTLAQPFSKVNEVYICLCVCMCIYACVYVCVCVCLFVCMYVGICIYLFIYVCTLLYIYISRHSFQYISSAVQ
jgi:hypothetical protein